MLEAIGSDGTTFGRTAPNVCAEAQDFNQKMAEIGARVERLRVLKTISMPGRGAIPVNAETSPATNSTVDATFGWTRGEVPRPLLIGGDKIAQIRGDRLPYVIEDRNEEVAASSALTSAEISTDTSVNNDREAHASIMVESQIGAVAMSPLWSSEEKPSPGSQPVRSAVASDVDLGSPGKAVKFNVTDDREGITSPTADARHTDSMGTRAKNSPSVNQWAAPNTTTMESFDRKISKQMDDLEMRIQQWSGEVQRTRLQTGDSTSTLASSAKGVVAISGENDATTEISNSLAVSSAGRDNAVIAISGGGESTPNIRRPKYLTVDVGDCDVSAAVEVWESGVSPQKLLQGTLIDSRDHLFENSDAPFPSGHSSNAASRQASKASRTYAPFQSGHSSNAVSRQASKAEHVHNRDINVAAVVEALEADIAKHAFSPKQSVLSPVQPERMGSAPRQTHRRASWSVEEKAPDVRLRRRFDVEQAMDELEGRSPSKILSSSMASTSVKAPLFVDEEEEEPEASFEDDGALLSPGVRFVGRFHWPHNLVAASRRLRMESSPVRDSARRGVPPRRDDVCKDTPVLSGAQKNRVLSGSPVRGRVRWRRELREARDKLIEEVFHGISADDA